MGYDIKVTKTYLFFKPFVIVYFPLRMKPKKLQKNKTKLNIMTKKMNQRKVSLRRRNIAVNESAQFVSSYFAANTVIMEDMRL